MIYHISKADKILKGTISLPASKSISNRVLVIRALCDDDFEIYNLSEAEDTEILKSEISTHCGKKLEINVGAAGTTMRFLTAYFAITERLIVLTGSERMKERPIGILVDALKQLGAKIEYTEKEGFPPIKIEGQKLHGGKTIIDGNVSSQYISALLMIAPKLKNGLTLELKGEIASRPYIEMTLKIMEHFGVKSNWIGNTIEVLEQKYIAKDFTVESDWSAASYWCEMAAFSDETDIILIGLKKESLQGDAVVAEIFRQFGVETDFLDGEIRLRKNSEFRIENSGLRMDCSAFPDLAQTLAVTCAGLGVSVELTGLQTLRIKETDRLQALKNELEKFGVEAEIISDSKLDIKSPKLKTSNSKLQTYADHRMAMAFAPLALKVGEISIKNPEVVNKSYPSFWDDLKKTGFEINEA